MTTDTQVNTAHPIKVVELGDFAILDVKKLVKGSFLLDK